MGTWTYCGDGLPAKNGEYLATVEHAWDSGVVRFIDIVGFYLAADTSGHTVAVWEIGAEYSVLAWMPLPKVYGE